MTENSQPLSPEDPASGNLQTCSNSAGKKRKRRRKKHKVEPRKEEQTTPAGGEVELCELSSDEENNTHNGQWLVNMLILKVVVLFIVNILLIVLFPVFRASSLSVVKDNMDHRQHSPLTALEWDSYPFSDGDWSPCTTYGPPALSCQIFTLFIQTWRNNET